MELPLTERKLALLAALESSSEEAILSLAPDGAVTGWNVGAERIYGYTAAEAAGLPLAALMSSGRPDEALRLLERVRRGERVAPHDAAHVTKGARLIDVSLSLFPLLDAAGNVFGACAVVRDVSERKRAQREFEARYKELDAFSYSVAHDLRAPLRHIDDFSRQLLEDCAEKLDPESRDHLERVCANSRRMSELIEALLNLSRLARSEIRPVPVDLSALAGEVAAGLRRSDARRRLDIVIAERLKARGDAALLRALLENLLSNAWKFTAKTVDAKVEVGATQRQGRTAYYVRDNGAGFDMAGSGKLFTPFSRLHSQGEFEGIGVGLSTVQRIVERHGGKVWAEAAVGRGATFYFTLR